MQQSLFGMRQENERCYGYVGRYIGFSKNALLGSASLAQRIDDSIKPIRTPTDRSDVNGEGQRRFDDITDHLSVRLGISLFERFTPQQLTGPLLMDKIAQIEYLEEVGSKITHTCQGIRDWEEAEKRKQREFELRNSQESEC